MVWDKQQLNRHNKRDMEKGCRVEIFEGQFWHLVAAVRHRAFWLCLFFWWCICMSLVTGVTRGKQAKGFVSFIGALCTHNVIRHTLRSSLRSDKKQLIRRRLVDADPVICTCMLLLSPVSWWLTVKIFWSSDELVISEKRTAGDPSALIPTLPHDCHVTWPLC